MGPALVSSSPLQPRSKCGPFPVGVSIKLYIFIEGGHLMEYSFLVEMVSSWCISQTAQFPFYLALDPVSAALDLWLAGSQSVLCLSWPSHYSGVILFHTVGALNKTRPPHPTPGPPCVFFLFCVFAQKVGEGGCSEGVKMYTFRIQCLATFHGPCLVWNGFSFWFVFGHVCSLC